MMFVKSRQLYQAIRLDGLNVSYPSWIQILILKNKLFYYPNERKWVLYGDECFYDGYYLVHRDGGIVGLSPEEFNKAYESDEGRLDSHC